MYTTTEKLYLAHAITQFTPENNMKICNYLKQRSLDINAKQWPMVYNELKAEMKLCGYTDIIAYCLDKRYEKLVEKMNETLKIRELIIENKIDPEEYLNEIKQSNLQKQKITPDEISKYMGTYIKQENRAVAPPKVSFFKAQTKEKLPEPVFTNSEIDIQVDVYNKQNKKYYQKMTQQDREFDDYLDTMEDKYYMETTINKKNDLVDYFPPSGKVKNAHEREELLGKEYKIHRQTSVVSTQKASIIDIEYMSVADKVSGRKNAEKDKSLWPEDMKMLLKVMRVFIDKNAEIYEEDKRLENIFVQLGKMCSLSATVLEVLIVLQDLLFKSKNRKLEKALFEFKRVIISFFDYYRK